MKIAFFTPNSFPQGMAMSKRLVLYAKCLIQAGGDVSVFAPCNINQRKKEEFLLFENINCYYYHSFSLISRFDFLWKPLHYAYTVFKYSKLYDVVYVTGGGWFGLLLLSLAVHLRKKKIICENCELPYSTELGKMDFRIIRALSKLLYEKISIPQTDGAISISKSLSEYITLLSPQIKNIEIPILIDNPSPIQTNPSTDLDKPFFLHTGSMSKYKDGIDIVLKALCKTVIKLNVDINFVFTGNYGSMSKNEMIKICNKYACENRLIFMGLISEEEITSLQRKALFTIINKPNNLQNRYNFPTKLGEFLIAGTPIIISNQGEMTYWLQNKKNALFFESNNCIDLENKITYLLANPLIAQQIGNQGKIVAQNSFLYSNYSNLLYNYFLNFSDKK